MKERINVYLNIYKINFLFDNYIPLYHTAIEYNGKEYSYGLQNNISGIFDMTPKNHGIGTFVISFNLGKQTRREFFTKLEKISKIYEKREYHFFTNNCNHFTNDYIKYVFHKEIPNKYQSFLKLGEFFRV
jgi:hypothetical protein